jgi:hypothetical protein
MAAYDEGDTIEYAAFGGEVRRVRVISREADVKDGEPGFVGEIVDGTCGDDAMCWGYDRQIMRVL